ncbi:tumor necrosis factor receptor superfamily member 14-like [Tachysurus vachellii]|uniref:tumor necrosis factor receptor superfamily member 14-like n=1 Tax=Tachysurus vachellii TaxID=175792 RepID=UPI00296AF3E7|nr:tumor necrosis factor receptor superfamily member 14-like [Tachysurus vachellii]
MSRRSKNLSNLQTTADKQKVIHFLWRVAKSLRESMRSIKNVAPCVHLEAMFIGIAQNMSARLTRAPCVDSFTSEPTDLLQCFSCAVCDSGQGLQVKTACTRISDTVCEPLEGMYCTNYEKGSCTQAVEHTQCSPGQYIKQKGTAREDAECAECKNGTYSDGSLDMCRQHTKCEDLGLEAIKPGTMISDVECGNKINLVALIVGIIVFIAVVAVAVVLFVKIRHKISRRSVRNAEKERGCVLP